MADSMSDVLRGIHLSIHIHPGFPPAQAKGLPPKGKVRTLPYKPKPGKKPPIKPL